MSNLTLDTQAGASAFPLRPYPELASQGPTLTALKGVGSVLSRVKEIISTPFNALSELFSYYPEIYLNERTFSIPSSMAVKSETETFDNKCNYIIRDSKIYFRPIAADPNSPWKEIPFPKKVTHITADGDNLIVVDEHKRVHYAKTNVIDFRITGKGWRAAFFTLAWKRDWFNMDLVATVINFLKHAGLYVMEGARAIAISHKGKEAHYHTDMAGKQHPDPIVGVTTLYMLDPTGTRILFADPWLPNKFHNEITGPDGGRFIAENMDASASTLFLIQRAKDAQGREINKMYTRYADFDSTGSNPLLPATYDPKNTTSLVRYLPGEDWLEQPSIPLEGNARLTKRIAILQTGRGQHNRELRVEGTDRFGQTGYYSKMIYTGAWKFTPTSHRIPQEAFLPAAERGAGLERGPQVEHDFHGWIDTKKDSYSAELKKYSSRGFNERGLHTTMEIKLESGETISCKLHAKRGMKHLLGLEQKNPNWTLVSPENAPAPFKTQNVEVIKEQHRIIVLGSKFKAVFPRRRDVVIERNLPSRPVRVLILIALVFADALKYTLKTCRIIINACLYGRKTSKAQNRFHHSLLLNDLEDTKKVMQKLVSKDPYLAPKVLMDFLSLPSASPHLRKIMHGANTLILGRSEELYQKLTQLKGAKQRPSSHAHLDGTSYGVEVPLFGELLFWKDKEGNLRLQFEAHSLRTIFKVYYHFTDYLRYKLHGEQQGLYGSTKKTDANPLVIRV